MGRLPTGVTVVTARDGEGTPCGLTVNAFTSVSLDPPLVLVCIDRASASHDVLLEAGRFGVNILSRDQADLAERFSRDPSDLRFDGIPWEPAPLGPPILPDTVGWLACSVTQSHRAGDHTILVGRVEDMDMSDREPLVFHRGAWFGVGPA